MFHAHANAEKKCLPTEISLKASYIAETIRPANPRLTLAAWKFYLGYTCSAYKNYILTNSKEPLVA